MRGERTTPITFRANATLCSWIDEKSLELKITRAEVVKQIVEGKIKPRCQRLTQKRP